MLNESVDGKKTDVTEMLRNLGSVLTGISGVADEVRHATASAPQAAVAAPVYAAIPQGQGAQAPPLSPAEGFTCDCRQTQAPGGQPVAPMALQAVAPPQPQGPARGRISRAVSAISSASSTVGALLPVVAAAARVFHGRRPAQNAGDGHGWGHGQSHGHGFGSQGGHDHRGHDHGGHGGHQHGAHQHGGQGGGFFGTHGDGGHGHNHGGGLFGLGARGDGAAPEPVNQVRHRALWTGIATGAVLTLFAPAIGRALRPAVRQVVKGGIVGWREVQRATSEVREDIEDISAEARAQVDDKV